MTRIVLLCCATFLGPGLANAAYLTFSSVTVGPTDTASGPQITVPTALSASDMISLSAAGTTCLQNSGTAYCTNAAGIVVLAGTTGVGGYSLMTPPSIAYGALLLGNSSLGFHPVFKDTEGPSYGFGSLTPPTTLTLMNATLGSLGFASGIGAGEILEFRLADTQTSDNSGGYRITDLSDQVQGEVPEPATFALVGAGAVALGMLRRRRS